MTDTSMTQQANNGNTANAEVEIDLLDLFSYYLSRLPFLIVSIIIGAVIAGLVTVFIIPVKYTATSKMYMVAASSDSVLNLADLNLGTSLSKDYVELMTSRPTIEDIIEKLNLDMTVKEVSDMLSLSVINDTRIIRIAVTSTDPELAMDVANQITHTTKVMLPKVMDAPAPTIVESAILPKEPSSPNLRRNIIVGALAALAALIAVLTVIYLKDDSVKSAEDLEKSFGVMPLSVIPEGDIAGMQKEGKPHKTKYGRNRATSPEKEKSGSGNKSEGREGDR